MGKKKGKKRSNNNNSNKPKKPMATLPPPSTPGTASFNQGIAEDAASIPLPASYSQDSLGDQRSNDMVAELLTSSSDLLVSASVESGQPSPVKTPQSQQQGQSLLPEDLISTAMNAAAYIAPAMTQSTTDDEDIHEVTTEVASNVLDETFYTTAMGESDDSDDITDDDDKLQGDLIQLEDDSPSISPALERETSSVTTPVATAMSPSRKSRNRPGNSFWTEAMAAQDTPKVTSRGIVDPSDKLDDVGTMKEISAQVTPKVAAKKSIVAKASPAPYDEVSTTTPEKTEGTNEMFTPKKNYDGKEPDVSIHVYDGAKSLWAWGKSNVPLAGFFMGFTETVASSIVTAATGTNLRDMDEKIIRPHLTGFDTDVLNPAIHASVDAILDDKEPQNPVQKFVFAPLRSPVRALCNSK
jgi:hypothetical protein